MTIQDIVTVLHADVLCGQENLSLPAKTACCSDLMSDVLAYVKDQAVLLTGLVNPQVVRTAQMMDMICIVFVRGKKPTAEMVELAEECGIAVMCSDKRAFEASGILYAAGLSHTGGH